MVVTYGEALVDLIEQPDGRFAAQLGGAVYNFTLAAARQGMPAIYLNPFSCDTFGTRLAQRLEAAGARAASSMRSALPTSLALVTLDGQQSPTYAFHRAAVADRAITPEQACALLPPRPALFHTGALALVPDALEDTLRIAAAALQAGAAVSIDANLRPLAVAELAPYGAGVRRALAAAHLVKVSDEDLLHMGMGGADPLVAARTLFDGSSVQLVALTLGARGAVLLSRQRTVTLPVPAGLRVVDTVGAGDCFHGGLVASLQQAGALSVAAMADLSCAAMARVLGYAIAAASINVQRRGCNPPTRDEVARVTF